MFFPLCSSLQSSISRDLTPYPKALKEKVTKWRKSKAESFNPSNEGSGANKENSNAEEDNSDEGEDVRLTEFHWFDFYYNFISLFQSDIFRLCSVETFNSQKVQSAVQFTTSFG